jgi:ferredoxin
VRNQISDRLEDTVKVHVDHTVCALSANCTSFAANVFRLNGTQLEYDAEPAEEDHDKVREAVDYCPTQAITVTE